MKVIDRALEWLKAEGYAPKQEEGFLVVKYQGGTFLIPDQGEESALLRVDYMIPREEDKMPSEEILLKASNVIHINIPLAKVAVYNDALVFSTSTLVCEHDDFAKVLPVLFDVALMSVQHFTGMLQQEQEEQATKQA